MLENFMFSVNATIPIFLVMVFGFFLRTKNLINDNFVEVANKFVFVIALPTLVFLDLASTDFREVFDISYVLFCAGVTTVCFFVIWALSKWLMKDKSMVGAFVQASFRSSAAVIGIAFVQSLYGDSGMAPLMIVGTVPLYNIYSVIVLTFEGNKNPDGTDKNRKERNGTKVKEACYNILTNPIIIGIVAGVCVSLLRIDFPIIIDKTLTHISSLSTPLALICLGASLVGKLEVKNIKPTLCSALIKLMLQAIIFLPIAIHMGYDSEKLVALVVMLAAPTTPSTYIMAKNMGNDEVLTASCVCISTLLSAVTLTFWIYLLRTMALI